MMMKFVLLAFVVAIAVAIERHPESDECSPKSVFYDKCNQCRCADDGKGAICTRQMCVPGEYNDNGVLIMPAHEINKRSDVNDELIAVDEAPEHCEYGRNYKIDCNRCFCSKDGKLSCTRMKCVNVREERSINIDYPQLPDGNCEFGKTYKSDCNTCICGKRGIPVCTLMECHTDAVYYSRATRNSENWGPYYQQGDACEPGKRFYSECNSCICGKTGKSAACTLKMCLSRDEE